MDGACFRLQLAAVFFPPGWGAYAWIEALVGKGGLTGEFGLDRAPSPQQRTAVAVYPESKGRPRPGQSPLQSETGTLALSLGGGGAAAGWRCRGSGATSSERSGAFGEWVDRWVWRRSADVLAPLSDCLAQPSHCMRGGLSTFSPFAALSILTRLTLQTTPSGNRLRPDSESTSHSQGNWTEGETSWPGREGVKGE